MKTGNTADISWPSGQPYSNLYEDIYFSSDSGLAETRHVFLEKNRLAERWKILAASAKTDQTNNLAQQFTIAETGFGTGLNFLCAWQLWNEIFPPSSATPAAKLHFISTESHPLTPSDMHAALVLWPELEPFSCALLAQNHYLSAGWHRLVFDNGRVTLTLLIGDVNQTLPHLKARVDAWFLDGFAPAKNPQMWQPLLFSSMARLSHLDTTFATFTSAGVVRRGLQDAGFTVAKVAGFGRKREMLCGSFQKVPASKILGTRNNQLNKSHLTRHAIVIGGGIAGCATSHALARRGWQVTLIERHATLAQEASGNPLGVIYPRLTVGNTALGSLALAGYLHTLRLLDSLGLAKKAYQACGVLQLAYDEKERMRCMAIAAQGLPDEVVRHVTAYEASQVAGIPITKDGLYFPAAGWVNPPALCHRLAQHANITILNSTDVLQLRQLGDIWQVNGAQGLVSEASIAILASANDTLQFPQSSHCRLEAVRGQISMVPQTAITQALRTVLCTDGYISPTLGGWHCIGATFSPGDISSDVRDVDHQSNLAMLNGIMPGAAAALKAAEITGRAALRCATPDYLPMAGMLLDSKALQSNPPRHTADPATLPWLQGLYVNTGHGAKGLVNAPLCAEIIASAICSEPAPVSTKLLGTLDPNRFLLRSMGLKRLALGLAVQV